MTQESLFLVSKPLLLLRRKFSFVLVFLQRDEVDVTDLDIFFKKKLYLDFSEVNMCLALRNYQVTVLIGVPLVFDTEGSRIIGDLDEIFFDRQFADLGSNQNSFLSLFY
jgi:hypothetical protein